VAKLTPEEFDQLAERGNLSKTNRGRLYQVLVEGKAVSEVAKEEGVSGEAIRKVMRRVFGSSRLPTYLSESQFRYAISLSPRMSRKTRELAYRVLVSRESEQAVAASAGIDRTTLNKLTNNLKSWAGRAGWRTITVTLPDTVAETVERWEEELTQDLLNQQRKKDGP